MYVNPLLYTEGTIHSFKADGITEEIDYSWYSGGQKIHKPLETIPEAEMNKAQAYSWVKAPRYHNIPFETGPLARQWLSGEFTL